MKGTDVTAEQYDAARRFIFSRESPPFAGERSDDTQVLLRFRDLVGLLAWYGAMRYIAGRDGINSLERPGDLVVVPPASTEPSE
jgi:hypothetical protein